VLRVEPGVAVARVGERIAKPDPRLQQDLADLHYAAEHNLLFKDVDGDRKVDLVDWVISMQFDGPVGREQEHAVERWRQTHSLAWLVAALTHLQSPDAELMQAAAAVPPDSPAWATAAYLRLRLMNKDAVTRGELERTRAELAQRHAGILATNLFSLLAREHADSLEEYLRLAPMQPVGVPEAGLISGNSNPTMAGLPVNVGNEKRLDSEAAGLLNEQLPLESLVRAVLESAWPKQLRFELAMAVWTRAVLLDRPEQARLLTPVMIEGEPGWKPWLEAYDTAASEDERRLSGLLAMMRFPSVRPYINAGAGREEGFVGYSAYRDNWWCQGMGKSDSWRDSYTNGYNISFGGGRTSPPGSIPSHGFISTAMAETAQKEHEQLEKIGDAPEYFGNAALAWVGAHPKDSRGAELLGFAFRAMRNGCDLEASVGLRRKVFATLHGTYPQSTWATKYAQFEPSSD